MQDIFGIWEQEELNTSSQNKENIHALNNNIAFLKINKYVYFLFVL